MVSVNSVLVPVILVRFSGLGYFCLGLRPGARGLHPRVCSRAPAGRRKIPRTILLKSPGDSCRVHKPGVPRGPASTPGLGPGKQHVVRGSAQKPKTRWARVIVRSPTGRSTQKQALARQPLRPTSSTGAFALGTSRLRAVYPIRKAWPKTPLPTPTPCL